MKASICAPTVWKLGARLPELIKEGVCHCLDGCHALLRCVLEQLGDLKMSNQAKSSAMM